MNRLVFISMLFFSFLFSYSQNEKVLVQDKPIIKVGVFDKNGDSPYCIIDAVESVKIDKGIQVRVVSASEIVSGEAGDIDVFIFPGGSGRSETLSLGELGQEKIIEIVTQEGKGVIGICAGAYILTQTPNYPSLALSGGEAIDIEHDHRGHGLVKFSLTKKGKEIFPELADRKINYSKYYEGPVLIPAKDSKYKYQALAVMESDVHIVAGSPADMTNNRPFIIITENGKGMSASVVGHPEATAGMRWMIPRLVRVVARREIMSYGDNVVRPEIYNKEILFTPDQQQLYQQTYDHLIGSKDERMQAITDMVAMSAWSAKKWIPTMLRDADFEVRLLAAKLTVDLERTDALPDLKAAVAMEENIENKKELQKQAILLEAMIGKRDDMKQTKILGLRTCIYKVSDLDAAKKWYAQAFGVEPYFVEPFYVGFNVGGFELGLLPGDGTKEQKTDAGVSYWGVDDIHAVYNRMIELGATDNEKPFNVGGELMTATLKDPWGNIIGLIYNPVFKIADH